MAKELKVGKLYKTKNDTGEIDFTYKVLEIKENKILYEIIENRSRNICIGVYTNIRLVEYNLNSQFIRNSELLEKKV